jgi:hypothetical protein
MPKYPADLAKLGHGQLAVTAAGQVPLKLVRAGRRQSAEHPIGRFGVGKIGLVFSRLPTLLAQSGAHCLYSVERLYLDGVNEHSEPLGDLGLRQAILKGQAQHFGMRRAELAERLTDHKRIKDLIDALKVAAATADPPAAAAHETADTRAYRRRPSERS